MRKTVSIILALAMVFTLAFPALAAEKKQTYDERVAAIKKTYGITYTVATYYPNTAEAKEFALSMAENALKRMGASAIKKSISSYIKTYGSFYLKFGTDSKDTWENFKIRGAVSAPGYHINNSISFLPYIQDMKYEEIEEKHKSFGYEFISHEFAHAWDIGFLGGGGNAKIEKYDRAQGLTQSESMLGWDEEFAYLFCWMQSREEFDKLPKLGWIDENELEKCKIIYELMLRDFGSNSSAVKKAAKFLGKELPKE